MLVFRVSCEFPGNCGEFVSREGKVRIRGMNLYEPVQWLLPDPAEGGGGV